ncbi:hypothetical protein RPALISO_205 [Ruegeria phage RpAliso]|nr:hypothetical protein RPALISO_205 [Ruegeria phage RpAliso]
MTKQFSPEEFDMAGNHRDLTAEDITALMREFFGKLPTDAAPKGTRAHRAECALSVLVPAMANVCATVIAQHDAIVSLADANAELNAKIDGIIKGTSAALDSIDKKFVLVSNAFTVVDQNFDMVAAQFGFEENADDTTAEEDSMLAAAQEASFDAFSLSDLLTRLGLNSDELVVTPDADDEDGFGDAISSVPSIDDEALILSSNEVGFRLTARPMNVEEVDVFLDYLTDVTVALFQNGLIGDEESDVVLDIISKEEIGEDLAIKADAMVDSVWSDELDTILRLWWESETEGSFVIPHNSNVPAILIAALLRVAMNAKMSATAARLKALVTEMFGDLDETPRMDSLSGLVNLGG